MTKFFKGKKLKVTDAIPRSQEELNKEYTELISKLGIEQFKLSVSKQNIDVYTQQLMKVNAEAHARTELDKKEVKDVKAE